MNVDGNKNYEYFKSQIDNRNFRSEVFIIPCTIKLSFFAKNILESCCNKQFYQVLETIEYSLKSNLQERAYLLQIFYAIGIAMQNNTNASFFNIRIDHINIKKTCHLNKINCQIIETNYLIIKSYCTAKPPRKKKEPYW